MQRWTRLALAGALAVMAILGCDRPSGRFDLRDASRAREGQQWSNSIGMTFVLLPSGTFIMGSDGGDADGLESPRHPVTVSRSFLMATTEVTQLQWRTVMGGNPSRFQGDDLPVEQVSWNDAQQFLRRLNELEGTARYRLPTEAEWEYACRAESAGDITVELHRIAWYEPNSGGATHRVGEKAANGRGLFDMLGNVYEWCEDWQGAYPSAAVTDPHGPPTGAARVVRGGSWLVHANRVRPDFRDFLIPDECRDDVGFRVVADAGRH